MHEQSDIPVEYREVPIGLLKKGTGRFAHVVLVPQPSDDPNDPLNVYCLHTNYAILRLMKSSGRDRWGIRSYAITRLC